MCKHKSLLCSYWIVFLLLSDPVAAQATPSDSSTKTEQIALPPSSIKPEPTTKTIQINTENTETPTGAMHLEHLVDPTQPVELGPMKRSASSKSSIKAITVQMIAYLPTGRSYAVINGKRLMEGDVFEDTTIQKIERDKVILSNPTRKPLVLEYANLSIKKNEGTQP